MPIDDHTGAPFGSAELAAAYAGPDYGAVLWEPTAESAAASRLAHYARWLADRRGLHLDPGQELWEWSVTDLAGFWGSLWDYFGVAGERGDGPVLTGGTMPDVRWFPGATLNYARQALLTARPNPSRTAVIYRGEDGRRGELTYGELDREVARVAAGLAGAGVRTGDRVGGYLPNVPEALIAMLAAASLGAIWSSCSPDFGATSVIDRFAQISPKVLVAVARLPVQRQGPTTGGPRWPGSPRSCPGSARWC